MNLEPMGNRKKILLYNPAAVFYDMPLALLSIGSMLDPKVYEVIIVDARVDKMPINILKEVASDAICLGITTLTGAPLKDALYVSKRIKAEFPRLPIVWGGWHASLFPEATLLEAPEIDITVQGQGEMTFKSLVYALDAGSSLEDIEGITFRSKSGQIIKNKPRPIVDMNLLAPVNYDLISVEKYFKAKKKRQFDYISSTGCRFRCTFCADPYVYNRNWTGINPERMGAELDYWYRKYGFDDINFQDETFFTYRKRISGIAQELLDRQVDVSWAGTLRADQGSRMNGEEYDLCKESGLRRVLVGVESGSQEMMDWLSKDIRLEQVIEVAEHCARRDIHVIFPFIVGFPNETIESVYQTLQLAFRLNNMHTGFTTPIFYYKPYPGSKITDEVVLNGFKLPSNLEEWSEFDYIGSSGPWVDQSKYKLIESFKFYNKVAGRNNSRLGNLLGWIAKKRCETLNFYLPWEQYFYQRFFASPQLS